MTKYTVETAKKRTKFVSRKSEIAKKIENGSNLLPYSKALFEYYRTNIAPPGENRPNYKLKMVEFKKLYDTATRCYKFKYNGILYMPGDKPRHAIPT